MPARTDHHREKPTERRSSDYRNRDGAGDARSARPHSSSQSHDSTGRGQSLSDQLLSAAKAPAHCQHRKSGILGSFNIDAAVPNVQCAFRQRMKRMIITK